MLEKLEPQNVFAFFEQLTKIPHGSGNTEQMSDFLISFAKERNLECRKDTVGNVIIKKNASVGYEEHKPVMIQGHMDMVLVKDPESQFDLSGQALELEINNDYLTAKETSLGADDGIAVAYMLALLDGEHYIHPPLECIITVDEEVGMEGATALDLSDLNGKRLINIDTEEEGEFVVSCAGGVRVTGEFAVFEEPFLRDDTKLCIQFELIGLQGGHSGTEIDKGRANANVLMGKLMARLYREEKIALLSLSGGLKDNAIPIDAKMIICVDSKKQKCIEQISRDFIKNVKEEYKEIEPDLGLVMSVIEPNDKGFFVATEKLEMLSVFFEQIPNGVIRMSEELVGLVETSLNLGIIEMQENNLKITFAIRSSVAEQKEKLKLKITKLMELNGGNVSLYGDYPEWEYQKESELRKTMVRMYEEMYQKSPKILSIHAGLECGIIAKKIKNLDCISIGPDMKDIHTTKEVLSISSTKRVWEFLLKVLANL